MAAVAVLLLFAPRALAADAPIIASHPKNRSVLAGSNHTFAVTATGDAPLAYRWQFNGAPLNSQTNSTLSLTNIQPLDAGGYRVIVSNAVGSATSLVATLTVRTTNDPAYPAPEGGWLYLYAGTSAASSSSAALDGTWARTTTSDSWGGDGRGAGTPPAGGLSVSNGVLTMEDAVASGLGTTDNRRFYFIHNLAQEASLTNASTVLNDGVTLTFRARLTPATDPLIELTNAPNGYVNSGGGKGMFGIRQGGASGMLISFTLNGASEDLSTSTTFNFGQAGLHMNTLNGNVRSGAVDPGSGTLNLLSVDATQYHEFWITIEDNGGAAGTHRVSVYVDGNTNATVFNVTAGTGSESPSTITNYLALGLPSTSQRGAYDIDFYGYAGRALTPAGYNDPVVIASQPANQTVAVGGTATFAVTVSGTPPFAYRWYRDGQPIANATNRVHTVSPVMVSDDQAQFTVVVSNICNIVTSAPPAVLQILQPPVITAQPQSLVRTNGDAASFIVMVNSASPPAYQWRFNGSPLNNETNQTLAFASVTPAQAGNYDVVVTNSAGSTTSQVATLVVRVQDFGDAPAGYPTLTSENGARHLVVPGVHLGTNVDFEVNGLSSVDALGDDADASDDEDGVSFMSSLRVGDVATVQVVASTSGVLNAWIDFDGNGSWSAAGEQVFTNLAVFAGTNALQLTVPATATALNTFSRFRFVTAGSVSFDGPAADGEVEDHAVTLVHVADLGLTSSDSPDPATLNSNLVYTLTVTNVGPSLATAVMLTNVISANVTFVSASASQGSCAHNAGTVACALGNLPAQAAAVVTITVTPTVSGLATNTATVTAQQYDPVLVNNTASEQTAVETAPSIISPPASVTVTQGQSATFSVVAAGSSPLIYQWFFGVDVLANETNSTLAITNVQAAQAGDYTVRVTNRFGMVTSAPATLTVLAPPSITQQPQSQTNHAGSDVMFLVVASGTAPLSYQWYFGATSISAGTNSVLTLTNVQKAQSGDYTVVVQNSAGVVTSAVARLTVLEFDFGDAPAPYPTLTSQDGARHILLAGFHLGASIDFESDGQPSAPANGDDLLSSDDEDGVTISAPFLVGRTNTILVSASAAGVLNAWIDWNANGSLSDAGDQIVTNRAVSAGANTLFVPVSAGLPPTNTFARFRFSSASGLSFTGEAPDGEVEDYPLSILPAADLGLTATRSPSPVAIGSNLLYSIAVTNRGPSPATSVVLSNVHSGNIAVTSTSASQGGCSVQDGVITCSLGTLAAGTGATVGITVVPNSAQNVTNAITITSAETDPAPLDNAATLVTAVQAYPAIVAQPQSQTVTNGGTAQFSVAATGTALSYQWRFDGADLLNQTNSNLSIINAQTSNAGPYTVRITNGVGAVVSDAATLTVLVPAHITSQPTSQTVTQGATATFNVVASGTAPIAYQWFLNAVEISGAVGPTLTISNAQPEDEGTYTVLVSNSAGSETSPPATLTVLGPAVITTQPASRTNFAGTLATFSVTASGTPPLSYQWYFDLTPIPPGTNSTLTLTNVQKNQSGGYFVVVTNNAGQAISAVAQLTVIEADFGDAPDIGYPTVLTFNGARHELVPGLRLGAAADFEPDGQPNANATGDDSASLDDEDGVVFTSPVFVGQTGAVQIVVSANGFIDAWIDFDGNGSWADVPDQIFDTRAVSAGTNNLTYQTPSLAVASDTFARFRFSTAGNLPPDGPAANGEVEDYAVTVLPAANLSVSVASTPEPAPGITNLTYAVAVSNAGPSTATGIWLTNVLPAYVQFVSASASQGSCTNQSGRVICQLGSLSANAQAQVTIVVTPQRTGLLTSRFNAIANEMDSETANNSVAHVATVIDMPTVLVNTQAVIIADNSIASPYPSTITVSTLTSSVHKVTVTLSNITHAFPADMDILLAAPNGRSVLLLSDAGAVASSGVTLTFDDDSALTVQEGSRLIAGTYKPTNYGTPDPFPAPAPAGPYSNALAAFKGIDPNGVWSLYVVDDEAADAGNITGWSLRFTTLDPLADVGVSVIARPEPVALESNLTYTITVTNLGPAAATSVVITNTLPADVTFLSMNTTLGSCSHSNGVVSCAIPTLARNGSGTITLTTRTTRRGNITNLVSIASIDTDLVTSNNTASAVSSVRAVADLVLSMDATPEPAAFNGEIIYSLRVTNRGPNRAHEVLLSNPLPPAVTFVGAAASQGSCSNIGGTVRCFLGELPAFTSATATITGQVSFIGMFTNTAVVTQDEIDLNFADNTAAEVTTGVAMFGFQSPASIAIPSQGSASPYPSTINVSGLTGDVYEVTVTLSNLSHSFPDDLDVLLVGPEGQSTLLMSDAGGGAPISNVILSFNDSATAALPDSTALAAGLFRPTQYDGAADFLPSPAPAAPFGTNLAVFKSSNPNGVWSLYAYDDTAPNSGLLQRWSMQIATLNPIADLMVTASASKDPVAAGSNLVYSITATNRGPAPAMAARLTNTLPSSVTFVSVSTDRGTCAHNAGMIVCDFGELASGLVARATINVVPNVTGTISNQSSISSATRDHRPLNNSTNLLTLVEAPPVFTQQPQSLVVTNGDSASFMVAVDGTPPLDFQWQHNGVDLPNATNASLVITNAQLANAGAYRARASNRVGAAASSSANLTVLMQPVISAVTSRATDEDTATGPIAFTVEDFETAASALNVTATSSSSLLVPAENIFLTGIGTNRTLEILPGTNQFGTCTIILTVQDAHGLTSSTSFDLDVHPVNDPPIIETIAAQATAEDTPHTIGFTVGDLESNPAVLVLAMTSSNPSIVPTNTAIFGGLESNRTVQVFPAPDQSGVVLITVIVADPQGAVASNSFNLTIHPVNDAPTLAAISPVSADEDAPPLSINLSGITSGATNEAQLLTLTAESSNPTLVVPSLAYLSPNSTGALTLTFATNAHGTATITVSVNDGALTNNTFARAFDVTVHPVNDPPHISTTNELSISEDTTAEGIAVMVGDLESAASQLTITGVASNAALIPATNIVVTGDSSNRLVRITPGTNQFGTTTVSLTVTDPNGGSATSSFLLHVQSVNDLPVLDDLAPLTLSEDAGLTAVQLTGIGAGGINEEQPLTVTATLMTPGIVTNVSLSYTSPAPVAILSFGTISNLSGTAQFGITIDDGGASNNVTTRVVTAHILPVNDLPSISAVPDQTIDEDTATATLPFTIGDVETPAADLTVTAASLDPQLIPISNIALGGAGQTRTVMVTPAPDRFGTTVVTLAVSDLAGTNTSSFVVVARSVNDLPFLSSISDQVASEDVPLAIGFAAGDVETPNMLFSLASSNLNLLGQVEFAGSGTNRLVTITPISNYFGSGMVTLTATDADGVSVNTSFHMLVNPVNDPPAIGPIADQETTESTSTASIPFSISDLESSSQGLTLSAASSNPLLVPPDGIVFGGSGSNPTVTITPAPNQSGSAVITITARDEAGDAGFRPFTLTVRRVNNLPTLAGLSNQTIAEDAVLHLPFAVADSDTPLSNVVVTATSLNPALLRNAGIAITGDGSARTLRAVPETNASGVATITLIVSDGEGASTNEFQLTVQAVNDPPVLTVPGDVTLNENAELQTLMISGIGPGASNEGQLLVLTATSSGPAILGNLTLSYTNPAATAVLQFTPVSNAVGSAIITITADDGGASNNTTTRSFTVTLQAVNDPPAILPIAPQSTPEDTLLGVPFTVVDPDTPLQSLVITATSTNQALVANTNITIHGASSNRVAAILPSPNEFGTTEIQLTITDGSSTSTQNFLVNVTAVNDPPGLAALDNVAVIEGAAPQTITLSQIHSGAANEAQSLFVTALSGNPGLIPHPTITYTNPASIGFLRFAPAATGLGTATITVTLNDGAGSNNVASRAFTVYVRGPDNSAPTISPITNRATVQGTPVTVDFQISDRETPVESLSLSATSSNLVLVPQANLLLGGSGTNRTLQVTPAGGQIGSAVITVSVRDLAGAVTMERFTLLVTSPPPALTLSGIASQSTPEDVPLAVPFTLGHPFPELSVLAGVSSDTALIANTNILFNGSGSNRTVTLVPSLNATGTTLITLTATNSGSVASRLFTVNITPANDAPTLNPLNDVVLDSPGSPNARFDLPLSGIGSGAANENQALSVTATSSAATIATIGAVTYTSASATGTVRLDLVRNAVGSTIITVNVSDGLATTSRTFTLYLKSSGNSSPTISGIASVSINEDTSTAALPFTIGDASTPVASLVLRATSLNPLLVPTSNIAFGGSGASRNITVTPLANRSGVAPVIVSVTDGNQGLAYTNFTVTVQPVNDLPTMAFINGQSMLEDGGTLVVPFIIDDLETPAGFLVVSNSSSNGSLLSQSNIVISGSGSNRVALITPLRDQSGSAAISITARDPEGGSASRTFTLNVSPVDDPPTLDEIGDTSISRGGSRVIPLTGISSGAQNENQTLTVTAVSSQPDVVPQIAYTSPDATGSLTLTANPAAGGAAVITVTVTESGAPGSSISRSFDAAIQSAGNSLPVITGVTNYVIPEDTVLGPVSISVSDAETASDALLVTASSSNPALVPDSNITISTTGSDRSLTISSLPNAFGSATITLSVADSGFGSTSSNFVLTVTPVNDPPVISQLQNQTIPEDTETPALPVALSDVDDPVGSLALQAISADGVLVPISNVLFGGSGSNRTVQVRPALNQSGSALVTIRALDASGGANDAPFTLTVTPLNDAPSLSPIPDQVMNEDTTLGPIPLTLDDPEPGALTLSIASSNPALLPPASIVSGGSGQNQTLTFSPLANQFGDAIVTVTVADGTGASSTNRFRVTVTPINDPPGIDSIADRHLPLNAGPQTIALTGINSGASNEAQPLWVSAVSSNPQLIPHPSVTFSGAPTLSFAPNAGVGGIATITVSVNDGQAQNNITTRDFTVTVETAPEFAAMADVHTDEDVAAGPIPLAVLDTDTPVASLALRASSSNPQLLANSNIVLSATPTNHALTLTPSPNQHGFSIVTLVATDDDGNAGTNTFAFIVHPVNDAPVVSPIPDQHTATNQTVGPIAFSISDIEAPAAQLEVAASSSNTELVPHASITLGGGGDTRTITIQPAPNRAGASTITITVTDPNGGAGAETFVVRVSDSPVAPFITTHPADQTVFPGGSATFLVTAGGTHPMTYLWRHGGAVISGATTPILSLSGVAPSQAGQYTVTISNAAGTVTSTPARLTVPFDLRIASIAWAAGTVTLTFETYAGATYTVEYADSLAAPSWTVLQSLTGNGATATVTDPAPGSRRFYRLTLD